MRQPKFSIVIPTRFGHETLSATLKTCLDQDFDDYEVVVVDNASLPETRAVVERFVSGGINSDRLRYIRHDEPLAMTENWNRALSYARGEWITFLGDDDALLPGALRRLDWHLDEYPSVKAVRWPWCTYCWPTPETTYSDRLHVPMFMQTSLIPTRQRLASMLATGGGPIVPHTYHSATHFSLVEAVTATGPFFSGPCPDLSSGVAAALCTDTFLELRTPFSVLGFSQRSNTLANNTAGPENKTAQDFRELNARSGLRVHEELPDLIELSSISYWDALFRGRDRFPAGLETFEVPPETIVQAALDSITLAGEDRTRQVHTILDWWQRTSPTSEYEPVLPDPDGGVHYLMPVAEPGIFPNGIVVDAAEFGVRDVAEAAAVASALLDFESCLLPVARRQAELTDGLVAEHREAAAQSASAILHDAARQEKEAELQDALRQLRDATRKLRRLETKRQAAEAELRVVRRSRSWRLARRMSATATSVKRPFVRVER